MAWNKQADTMNKNKLKRIQNKNQSSYFQNKSIKRRRTTHSFYCEVATLRILKVPCGASDLQQCSSTDLQGAVTSKQMQRRRSERGRTRCKFLTFDTIILATFYEDRNTLDALVRARGFTSWTLTSLFPWRRHRAALTSVHRHVFHVFLMWLSCGTWSHDPAGEKSCSSNQSSDDWSSLGLKMRRCHVSVRVHAEITFRSCWFVLEFFFSICLCWKSLRLDQSKTETETLLTSWNGFLFLGMELKRKKRKRRRKDEETFPSSLPVSTNRWVNWSAVIDLWLDEVVPLAASQHLRVEVSIVVCFLEDQREERQLTHQLVHFIWTRSGQSLFSRTTTDQHVITKLWWNFNKLKPGSSFWHMWNFLWFIKSSIYKSSIFWTSAVCIPILWPKAVCPEIGMKSCGDESSSISAPKCGKFFHLPNVSSLCWCLKTHLFNWIFSEGISCFLWRTLSLSASSWSFYFLFKLQCTRTDVWCLSQIWWRAADVIIHSNDVAAQLDRWHHHVKSNYSGVTLVTDSVYMVTPSIS